jgi:hypothetical protein
MNAVDIMKYGHATVCKTIDGLPVSDWEIGGVCGYWSVKDIIGHLAAHEYILAEVLATFLGEATETPYFVQLADVGMGRFNDIQAETRKNHTVQTILEEYNSVHARALDLVQRMPPETLRDTGTIPWYGPEYSLDDWIVYGYYGHKREHSAQIDVFRDQQNQKKE